MKKTWKDFFGLFSKRPGKICTTKERKESREKREQNMSDPLQMDYYLFKGLFVQCLFWRVRAHVAKCPFYSQKLHQTGLLPNKDRRNR